MRTRTLYVDVDAVPGVNVLLQPDSPNPLNTQTAFVQGDRFTLRVAFMKRKPPEEVGGLDGVVYQELAAGDVLVLAGREGGNVVFGQTLFVADGFVKVVVEEDEAERIFYEAVCNLHTTAIARLFQERRTTTMAIAVDLEVQNAGNTERVTYRFGATLLSEAYQGEEPPEEAGLLYPPPSALVTADRVVIAPGWRIVVGPDGAITTEEVV